MIGDIGRKRMDNRTTWFVCTKDFTCLKCGKVNSVSLPLKASVPVNKKIMNIALADQRIICSNQDCKEPAASGGFEIVEATESEIAIFESNPNSDTS
jgi:transcription elongation factor Elf1